MNILKKILFLCTFASGVIYAEQTINSILPGGCVVKTITQVTDENFEPYISKTNRPIIVYFDQGDDIMGSKFKLLASYHYRHYHFVSVDMQKSPIIAEKYTHLLDTLIIFSKGSPKGFLFKWELTDYIAQPDTLVNYISRILTKPIIFYTQ